MKPVSQEEFFAPIKQGLDVHPSIQPGPWPYTSVWKYPRDPSRKPYGKSVCRGGAMGGSDYFVNE